MDLNALSPYIRMAWDCTVSFPIKEIPRRIIYDYELIYIKEGSGSIEIEDRQYFFRPGDLYFLRPNVPHWIKLDEAGFLRQPHIHFDLIYRQDSPRIPVSFKQYSEMTSEEKKMIREDICREPPLDLPEKIVLHNQDHFEELLFDVIDEFQTKGALYEITVKLKFLRLWAYLLNEHRQNSSPPFPAGAREMERVKDYIHLHVKDPLTLD